VIHGNPIELNELADAEIKKKIELEILWSVGLRRMEDNWKAWIHVLQDCCYIVLTRPTNAGDSFVTDVQEIPRTIATGLSLTPSDDGVRGPIATPRLLANIGVHYVYRPKLSFTAKIRSCLDCRYSFTSRITSLLRWEPTCGSRVHIPNV
jgi:hypothetical protein